MARWALDLTLDFAPENMLVGISLRQIRRMFMGGRTLS
jgi:hypothetical protein